MVTNHSSKRPSTTLRPVVLDRLLPTVQGSIRCGSFGLNDLEALMNVAFEAKEWIIAHALKRRGVSSFGPPGPSFLLGMSGERKSDPEHCRPTPKREWILSGLRRN